MREANPNELHNLLAFSMLRIMNGSSAVGSGTPEPPSRSAGSRQVAKVAKTNKFDVFACGETTSEKLGVLGVLAVKNAAYVVLQEKTMVGRWGGGRSDGGRWWDGKTVDGGTVGQWEVDGRQRTEARWTRGESFKLRIARISRILL